MKRAAKAVARWVWRWVLVVACGVNFLVAIADGDVQLALPWAAAGLGWFLVEAYKRLCADYRSATLEYQAAADHNWQRLNQERLVWAENLGAAIAAGPDLSFDKGSCTTEGAHDHRWHKAIDGVNWGVSCSPSVNGVVTMSEGAVEQLMLEAGFELVEPGVTE